MESQKAWRNQRQSTPHARAAVSRSSLAHFGKTTTAAPSARSLKAQSGAATPTRAAGVAASAEPNHLPIATTWDPVLPSSSVLVGSSGQGKALRLVSIDRSTPMNERYGSIVNIPAERVVVFQGIVDICVLSGAVSACEYTILPEGQWRRLYSPSSHPLVSVRSIRAPSSAASAASGSLNGADHEVSQLKELWNARAPATGAGHSSSPLNPSEAVVVFRSVSCGLEHIGTAAPPYRNLFALKHFSERKEMGLPKKPAKRMLALSRLMEASRIKSAAGEQESRDMPLTDADSDKPPADDDAMESDSSVDEFSTAVEYMRREALLAEVIGVANFYPVSHLTSDLQLLQVPQDWVEPLNLASSSALQLDDSFEPTPPVYVIAGPQGQGKSTFSRLLINRLVARYGCVFYMETDVGQSELAPPGALSLSMLTDPLLGPPFTHSGHLEAYHASYLGATTPKHSPDHYVAAIKRLAALYREHVSTARMQRALATKDGTKPAYASSAADLDRLVTPLVVNTQGWLKGLGLDLHYSLCEAVRPTNYIQLYDSTSGPDRPEGETSNWSSVNGLVPIIDFSGIEDCSPQLVWISAMGYERATLMLNCQPASMPGHSTNDSEPSCESTPGDIFPLAAFASTEIANRKGNKLAAHDMRTLSLISQLYLIGGDVQAQAWNASLQQLANPQWSLQAPLASQRPLAVPLTDLIFWLGEEDVPPSQLPRVLNGSIVGVVAISTAPSLDSHIWTETEIRGLYSADNGISDQAAVELSEPGSRVLLRAGLNERCPARQRGQVGDLRIPHIVQGQPNLNSTTFLAHALVRSVDLAEGCLHLLLPPSVACLASASLGNSTRAVRLSPLSRIVGLVKGPGPNMAGVELPVWAMVDGGYAERAMGSSSTKRQGRFNRHRASGIRGSSGGDGESVAPLGIQEAPYLSVEADGGIGASSTRSKGGMQRRALQ